MSLLFVVGFASSASADTYQTYVVPTVNGFQIGTLLPNQATVVGTNGVGNWNTTGNANTCITW
ncbi:hypothetical protein EJ065_4668 [Corallococcus coralloides]|uniref:Uncharacterized protein n=1 Tax=Corallococcus coralloides TaxID=184914 RepID=A0A410RWK3_CORCK|nr:hypothetical protein [Corallococcus coralloides]QAT86216.1 hypothetical protein EJ065_4668 [Corallococcus coralloides]